MRPTSIFGLMSAAIASGFRNFGSAREMPFVVSRGPLPPPVFDAAFAEHRKKSSRPGTGARRRANRGKKKHWINPVRSFDSIPPNLRHGAQRRRTAFAYGLSYEARSRHDGRCEFNEVSYAEFKAA